MDESRARFDEGLEQVRRLLEEENVTAKGTLPQLRDATIAAASNAEAAGRRSGSRRCPPGSTFETAGPLGHYLMGIPLEGAHMAELLQSYRERLDGGAGIPAAAR